MNNDSIGKFIFSLKIGDKICWNNLDEWFEVVGVSDRFILAWMDRGNRIPFYTIISKIPYQYQHNDVSPSDWYCGPDDFIFGYHKGYHFKDDEWVKEYLNGLENGEINISERSKVAIHEMKCKFKE